jgi:hypothetical protein
MFSITFSASLLCHRKQRGTVILMGVAAAFLFARESGGEQDSDEQQGAELFKTADLFGVAVHLFGQGLHGGQTVE